MSNYFNEAGEPLMDGSAMRYEMYLDSTYEPDPDEFYNRVVDEDYYYDNPDECPHSDGSYLGSADEAATSGDYQCDLCDQIVGTWVRGADGWPEVTLSDEAADDEAYGMEDQWLDSYMEDRISGMYE